MNDCVNAEMRDRLPDLLNDRLAANEQAEVVAHLAACADCREELELLRAIRSMLSAPTLRVDVARVVSALPKPPSRATSRPTRRTWADWRIAAAITVLAVGGSSVALINRTSHVAPVRIDAVSPIADSTPTTTPERTASSKSDTNPDSEASSGLGMSGHLDDLND